MRAQVRDLLTIKATTQTKNCTTYKLEYYLKSVDSLINETLTWFSYNSNNTWIFLTMHFLTFFDHTLSFYSTVQHFNQYKLLFWTLITNFSFYCLNSMIIHTYFFCTFNVGHCRFTLVQSLYVCNNQRIRTYNLKYIMIFICNTK